MWLHVIGLVTGALLARLLGVTGRGSIATIIVWSGAIAYVGDCGAPVAYAYLSARKPETRAQLGRNAVTITAFLGLALSLVAIPIVLSVVGTESGLGTIAVVYAFTFIPLNLTARLAQGIHQGARDFATFNRVRYSLAITYLIGLVILFSTDTRTVGSVVVVLLASNLVAAVVAWGGLSARNSLRKSLDKPLLKQTFSFGLRAHFGNLTPIDSLQLDIALIAILLSAREVGLYAVAAAAAVAIRTLGSSIGLVALPSVAAEKTASSRRRTSGLFFRAAFLVIAITALTAALTAPVLVPLIYGNEFEGAVPITQILVIGITAAALRQVLGDCLRGMGKPLQSTVAEVVSWVIAVAGLVVLIPAAGVIGAATAVSISYVVALCLLIALSLKAGISLHELLVPGRDDIALLRRILRKPKQALVHSSGETQ